MFTNNRDGRFFHPFIIVIKQLVMESLKHILESILDADFDIDVDVKFDSSRVNSAKFALQIELRA